MRGMPIVLALIAGVGAGSGVGCRGAEPIRAVRIYALDCGAMELENPAAAAAVAVSNHGHPVDPAADSPGRMVNVCYLIRHPKGDLLWDLGLGDELAEPASVAADLGGATEGIRLVVEHPLVAQLAEIDLTPADIEYIAFSHLHFDHTGNANRFPAATWILNRRELAWGRSTPTPFGVNPASWSGAATAKLALIDEDLDVFGDGSVRVIGAPGHTPGHQVLFVTFAQGGAVVLGGDLYQTRDNVRTRHVPAVSFDRNTLQASFERVSSLITRSKATLIVQHAPEDLALLPKFPLWLE